LRLEIIEVVTEGDRSLDRPLPEIGGKGVFTQELETALRERRADLAVHSLKDLPTEIPEDLSVGAVLERGDPRDVLVGAEGRDLDALPPGSTVGTSSLRRQVQLLALRPDLRSRPVRGNVETRIDKVRRGEFQAVVLAAAGVLRLGLERHATQWFELDQMLPAPGQGAIAVQCRADDQTTLELLAAIDHAPSRLTTTAERGFLHALGAGCSAPVGAFAELRGDQLHLRAVLADPDGTILLRLQASGEDPIGLGRDLALQALKQIAPGVARHA
ncbi:MAG TPA: hydroxymethylbilane synthase, partial [Anaerolineales bacterium]